MKKMIAVLTLIGLLISMAACGGTPAESSAAPASSAETAAPQQETQPESVPEPADEVSSEEPAEVSSISYPIEGDYTFSMVAIQRRNSIEAMGDNSYTATPAYEEFAKQTGVSLDVEMLGEASANETINLMMVSGDLPDIFNSTVVNYDSNLTGAVEEGILIDMASMLHENAPDYEAFLEEYPDIKASAYNSDGTLSVFTSSNNPVITKGLLIRQDWLNDLGMEAPTSFDGLVDVLKAFKSEKNATMPILVNFDLESGLSANFNAFFAGFRSVGYQLTEPNGKEVVCTYASDQFINYLLFMNRLYNEGVLTEDFMSTGREYGNWESSYYGGVSGVWVDNCKELDPSVRSSGNVPEWEISAFALSDEEDIHVAEKSVTSMNGINFITTACENPEICMQMFNYCYTRDGIDIVLYGVEGLNYDRDADGQPHWNEVMTNNENGWSLSTATFWYTAAQWLPNVQEMHYLDELYTPEAKAGMELWSEYGGDTSMLLPDAVVLTPEDSSEFNNLAGDVLTLFTENASRVVVGELDEAGYRDIIKSAEGIGLARMNEIYQDAYDAYLAA